MKKASLRIISVLLTAILLLPLAVACRKTPDNGDDERGEQNLEDYVFKIEEKSAQKDLLNGWYEGLSDGLTFVENIKHGDEEGTLYWMASTSEKVSVIDISDWSGYDVLTFWAYSTNACGATVQLRFSSPNLAGTKMDPYIRYSFKVDFEGWKEFRIPIDDFGVNYSADLCKLQAMYFDCNGWDMTPDPKCELYFGYMYLEKIGYEISPSLDDFGDEIYTKVTNNWRELLAGSKATNSSGSEVTKAHISSVEKNCKSQWDHFKSTYSENKRNSLFGISIEQGKSGDEPNIQSIYNKLLYMALGYGTYGNEYYQNKDLFEDIKRGLEYTYNYYYGPCVWENGVFGNWWEWDIGAPLALTKILILLEEPLGPDLVEKYLEPFDYLNRYPSMTACNKVWIAYSCLASAVLQKDGERLLISEKKLLDVFDYVTEGDGFYTDGSFIQHDAHPYTGGYGLSMLTTLTDIMYVLNGTRFQMIDECVDNQYSWIFDTYRPVIYNGSIFANTRGREVCRNTSETGSGRSAVVAMIKMAGYAPESVKARLEQLIKQYLVTSSSSIEYYVPIAFADYTLKIKNDDSIKELSDSERTYVLGNMDRVTQHNSKYAVSVSLSSTRIWKYEAINNENMTGWYLGDGMIYIYTDGYDYNYDFYHYVDPYKMPGTTVSSEKRTEENISGGIYNGSAFVGGVTVGKYGIALMELSPSVNNYFDSKLSAKKSYFMFDNEIVALGTGIKDTSGYDISTIVENRKWEDGDTLTVNGTERIPIANVAISETVSSMHFSNMGGYVFLDAVELQVEKATTSKTTFLEAWISHGKSPNGESYAYVYLPEASASETLAYQQTPDIEIIEQSETVHAVKETKLGATGYVFWQSGSCNGVTADKACALMVKEENGEITVSVSDPSQLLDSLHVTLELEGLGSSVTADGNISASVNGNTLTLDIDMSGNVGQSFTVCVK